MEKVHSFPSPQTTSLSPIRNLYAPSFSATINPRTTLQRCFAVHFIHLNDQERKLVGRMRVAELRRKPLLSSRESCIITA